MKSPVELCLKNRSEGAAANEVASSTSQALQAFISRSNRYSRVKSGCGAKGLLGLKFRSWIY